MIGKFPNRPGDQFDEDSWADLGILTEKLDADGAFAMRHDIRTAARRAFVRVDCGKRVARDMLRKSAPFRDNTAVETLSVLSVNKELKLTSSDGRQQRASSVLMVRRCAGVYAKVYRSVFRQIRYDQQHPRKPWHTST